ncbi:MAG TPA: glutamate racemase [Bacteroidales bacterium]|nr:glutamate racemase [Bacteroidales bacterium]
MTRSIGVFDSGIGGLTVLKELLERLPNEDFVYYADSRNAPYGHKSAEEIIAMCDYIIRFLLDKNCKIVVIACNTATAAAVQEMRKRFKIPIIAMEPAVKPACLNTKTRHIGVLATEGTFRGNHFLKTSEKYKDYVVLHLQVAKGLVELAEKGIFEGKEAESLVKQYTNPFLNSNIDQLVLGCTHYPYFFDLIKKTVGTNVTIVDSAEPVARRTKDMLMTNKIFRTDSHVRKVVIHSSGDIEIIQNVITKLFNIDKNNTKVELNLI